MSTDPQSPFEGVAIVRLRPLFFVLTALYVAALFAAAWKEGQALAGEAVLAP